MDAISFFLVTRVTMTSLIVGNNGKAALLMLDRGA